jgi:TolB protein
MGDKRLRRFTAAAAVAVTGMLGLTAAPAHATDPGTAGWIAFVRSGNIFVADPSGTVTQETTDGGYSWPRWNPQGETVGGDMYNTLAFLHKGNVDIADVYPGGFILGSPVSHGGHAGPPTWSPDGTKLAYLQDEYLYSVTMPEGFLRPGFSAARSTVTPAAPKAVARIAPKAVARIATPAARVTPDATGFSNLATSTAIAWSPDGTSIAIPNGQCSGIYDACLGVLNMATGDEQTVAVFGGGGNYDEGYATTPAWTPDGSRLMWTQQAAPEGSDTIPPMRVWSANPDGSDQTQVTGKGGDSIPDPSPAGDGSMLVTAKYSGAQWVTRIDSDGTRTYLFQGTQADWEPITQTF